ncbi:3BP5L protein, partial [Probosciger aterrimus]|nr:3BP5L protein [Probosciger aterrimus]
EARTAYRRILSESARKLNAQGSQLGNCIEKARPYYEARRLAKEAQQETQKAALRYERAVSMHNAAREMVFVAEQGVMADKNRLDPTWQEMLNHATCKVWVTGGLIRRDMVMGRGWGWMEEGSAIFGDGSITFWASCPPPIPMPTFTHWQEHKAKVTALELLVAQAKTRYSVALRNLEEISEQIHARRLQRLIQRRASPVGAEASPQHPIAEGEGTQGSQLGVEGAAGDTLSVLSLQTIASDLQKFDSVEHLLKLSDAASLNSEELEERDQHRGGQGHFKHHRSISL